LKAYSWSRSQGERFECWRTQAAYLESEKAGALKEIQPGPWPEPKAAHAFSELVDRLDVLSLVVTEHHSMFAPILDALIRARNAK